MNTAQQLGLASRARKAPSPVRTSGRLSGDAPANMPAGTYTFDGVVEVDGAHALTNPARALEMALRSTDQGSLHIASVSGLAMTERPWRVGSGADVLVHGTITTSAEAPRAALVRYVARGMNAALAGTGPNGQPFDRGLGGAILNAFNATTTLSSTASGGVIRNATLTIQRAPAAAPAPPTPHVVVQAPPQDIPAPPPPAVPPMTPAAAPTRAQVTHYQTILYNLGWLAVASDADGVVGSQTHAALRLFQDNYNREQAAHGDRFQPPRVVVNGLLDRPTQQALENYRSVVRWIPPGYTQLTAPRPGASAPPVSVPPAPAPPAPVPAPPPVQPRPPVSVTPPRPTAPAPSERPETAIQPRPDAPPLPVPQSRPPVAPAPPQQQGGFPWGALAVAAGVIAVGYAGYRYRHEIRASFDANAPAAKATAGRAVAAAGRGTRAAARWGGEKLSRYGSR